MQSQPVAQEQKHIIIRMFAIVYFMFSSPSLSAFDWIITKCFTHVRTCGGVGEGGMAVLWNGVVRSRYISLSPLLVSLSSAMGFWLY